MIDSDLPARVLLPCSVAISGAGISLLEGQSRRLLYHRERINAFPSYLPSCCDRVSLHSSVTATV